MAVHTSAMLREEQRASEIAFESGRARILFATGTLAQGLNLPATAVIVGGTSIGYDPTQDIAKAEQRARSQLLNAIGRAGRANVAARSMAIVIPNDALAFTSKFSLHPAIARARFLQYEDASSEIASQLDGMISRARDGSLEIRTMSRYEEVAFSFLSFSADGSDAEGVIRNTWAVHRARAVNDVDQVAQAIGNLGSRFLRDSGAPEWISLASHKAGLPLPATVELERRPAWKLQVDSAPESIKEWADCLIEVLQWLDVDDFSRIMSDKGFRTTMLAGAWSEVSQQRTDAWGAFRKGLHAWMRGDPIIDLASLIMRNEPTRPQGRGQSDAIPKVLGVVEDGFSFQLSIAAGALGAIVAAGRENDADGPWNLPETSMRYLNLLPLAVRLGTNSPAATAWMRTGARPRAVAHLLARILPPPQGMDDEEMRRYAQRQLTRHPDYVIAAGTSEDERELLRALIRDRGG
ncbi:helicase-related protein [Streptomyces coelicoflavus]|uniref:helicase-related protein n=1 Tax=Streptomyces coelicoflavus TaxID=285562 RepID=UPI00369C2BAB